MFMYCNLLTTTSNASSASCSVGGVGAGTRPTGVSPWLSLSSLSPSSSSPPPGNI